MTRVIATNNYAHSKTSRCVSELLNFRKLIIKVHSINIGTVLALNLASELLQYCNSACIFIPKEFEHVLVTAFHNLKLCDSQSACPTIVTDALTDVNVRRQCDCAIFLQWKDRFVDYEREQNFGKIIVITTSVIDKVGTLLRNRMYQRVIVRNIEGNRYLIKFLDKICFIVVERGIIHDMNIPHDIMKAYSVLRNYFNEFGALRVRDAINALSKELIIDKAKAREFLYNLVKLHLINIRSGYVEISMKSMIPYKDQEFGMSDKT